MPILEPFKGSKWLFSPKKFFRLLCSKPCLKPTATVLSVWGAWRDDWDLNLIDPADVLSGISGLIRSGPGTGFSVSREEVSTALPQLRDR